MAARCAALQPEPVTVPAPPTTPCRTRCAPSPLRARACAKRYSPECLSLPHVAPQLRYYHVVGRKLPTATETNPPLYRMRLFAPNKVVAKSRFWYFLHTLKKLKKTTGQILSVNEVRRAQRRSSSGSSPPPCCAASVLPRHAPVPCVDADRSWRRTPTS